MSDGTKEYVLKQGRKHSVIINGERRKIVGDGKATVSLTPAQADSFRDKLVIEAPATVEAADEPADDKSEAKKVDEGTGGKAPTPTPAASGGDKKTEDKK